MTALPALLDALVDDAGLFPPEELGMTAALARHADDERAGSPVLSHRFVCPAARLPEALAALGERELRLVLVAGPTGLPAALRLAAADRRVLVAAVDVRLPETDLGLLGAAVRRLRNVVPADVELWVETGWDLEAGPVAELLVRAGSGRKLRCGGVRAELFPTSAQLGQALVGASAAGCRVKATAGLHGAVRHVDPRTGFDHHGYANLLLAAARARDGLATVVAALEERERPVLAAALRALTPQQVAAARHLLSGYGSCSTSEPLEDAGALGLL